MMFERVEGIQDFNKYFPNKPWFHIHDVIEFRWYREFDYEEWCDRTYLKLMMSSEDKNDIVSFVFSDCEILGSVCFNGWISGLDIIDRTRDLQRQVYEIVDFEGHCLHMICMDFSIQIIQAAGKNIPEES